MPWSHTTKLNEGFHIEGGGKSIDLIVRSITGSGREKGAVLEVRGLDGIEHITLRHSDRYISILEGFGIGVKQVERSYGNRIPLIVDNSSSYSVEARLYEPCVDAASSE